MLLMSTKMCGQVLYMDIIVGSIDGWRVCKKIMIIKKKNIFFMVNNLYVTLTIRWRYLWCDGKLY